MNAFFHLRLATIRALEAAAAFVAGPEAVALHKRARAAPLAAAQREVAALRLALGSLVWVARGKASLAREAEEDLLALGIEIPMRELAGRIAASRELNETRRVAIEEGRRADATEEGLANLQRAHGLLLAAFNATTRTLSIAMDGDRFAVALAVERAQAALAKQNPAMHLDIAAVVARMGAPPATTLLTEGDPLYVGAAGCERCGNDTGSRHGTCYVAPDEDEPAVGDEPTLVSQ